mmetsp:Transcript_16476/g.23097  ORF Transcript_16476/g.23097 Transcript_16476/m.23097 type:complete len:240 (-) Transcript_16476:507-1226(-)
MLYLTLAVLLSAPHAAKACQSAQSLIEAAEGFRSCVYTDTTGHPTVCYGYNLDDYSAKSDIANVGADYDQVRSGKQCLSKSQCSTLLQGALSAAESGAKNVFGNQCSCIMAVLVDMTYNLGSAGVASFTTFKSYIENGQYSEAASDLKSTLWCSQVCHKCFRIVRNNTYQKINLVQRRPNPEVLSCRPVFDGCFEAFLVLQTDFLLHLNSSNLNSSLPLSPHLGWKPMHTRHWHHRRRM